MIVVLVRTGKAASIGPCNAAASLKRQDRDNKQEWDHVR